MDFNKIGNYWGQGYLFSIALMVYQFFLNSTAKSWIWQLFIQLNGGWQQILPILVIGMIQIFGWQILRILWFIARWAFFSGTSSKQKAEEKFVASSSSPPNGIDVRDLSARIDAMNKRVDDAYARIDAVNTRVDKVIAPPVHNT